MSRASLVLGVVTPAAGQRDPAPGGVTLSPLFPLLLLAPLAVLYACGSIAPAAHTLTPRVVTEPTRHDTDDPAIWINPADTSRSLIVGTDKDSDGALYVYDLGGRIVNRVGGLKRPNNVDIAYGLPLGGRPTDIAVTTERERFRLRVFSLPGMKCVDKGDLVVFDGDTNRAPMGIALYRRARDGAIYAFVGGKSGPPAGYIGQYRLGDDGTGQVKMTLVRQFGAYSGTKEIEAIAVDAELGYVYYSDETVGVRKYAADPDAPDANKELALFATSGFASDHEGISIYKINDGTGYILVSDQQANQFRIYPREGAPGRPHEHTLVKTVPVAAIESDGSEVTNVDLGPTFPHGLFVAMSNGRVFHYYAWEDVAGRDLKIAPNGVPPRK
jgi:3-phytase